MPLKHKHKRSHNVRSLRVMSPGWTPPIASGGQQVIIQQVYPKDPNTLQWNFSSGVSGAPGNVPQLLASGDGSTFHSPTGVTATDGGLQATYSSPVLSPGCVYPVTAPPTGVTFASGTLSVPQTGTVISAAELAGTQGEAAEFAATQAELEEAAQPATLKLTGTKARKAKAARTTTKISSAKPKRTTQRAIERATHRPARRAA